MAGATGTDLFEERLAFFGENNVARLAALARLDCHRAGVRVEVVDLQRHKLAETGAGFERGLYQQAEVGIAAVDKPLRLGDGQIANARGVDLLEWSNARPFCVRGDLSLPPRHV